MIRVFSGDVPAWADAAVRAKFVSCSRTRRGWDCVDSEAGSGETHKVVVRGSLLICDCRGFYYRLKCKHVVAVAQKRRKASSLLYLKVRDG